ncbi:MAG: hypothetical protein NOU37_01545 [Candidatus Brocadiales bacterium]|nr:hypothetical protein [Candidatus Bathyanammoxibius sp.]MCQ4573919.1 hypothetical protein [Candidatus Bathyanammoxibius amoris]
MHRFIKILTCYLLLSVLSAAPAQSIQLELSEKDIKDALEYGNSRRELSHPEVLEVWRVNLGYGVGSATVITPFGNLAILSKEMSRRSREPSEGEIKKTLSENRGKLVFGCSIYGDDAEFADEYKAVLMYKDKKLEPSEKEVPASAEYTRSFPDSPRYWALCFYKFDIPDLDPKAKVTLILKNGDGKKLSFPFNLAKLR